MRADIPLRFVVSCGTFVICTQEGIGKRVLSIREILKKHPIELTTAGICGFVCLVFLLPAILSEFLGRSGYEGSGSANVVVYHKMSKRPIFGGATRRDAVEKRIASIREMLRYEAGFATEDVSWEEVNAYFEGLEERSREQFKEQRTLYCSMESADLRDTDLSGLDFRGLSLRACDLSECKFDGARLEGSLLLDADFDESSFQNMDLRTVDINPGQVKSADFSGAILEGKRFGFGMNCIYRNANLRNVTIEHRTAMGMNVRGQI